MRGPDRELGGPGHSCDRNSSSGTTMGRNGKAAPSPLQTTRTDDHGQQNTATFIRLKICRAFDAVAEEAGTTPTDAPTGAARISHKQGQLP